MSRKPTRNPAATGVLPSHTVQIQLESGRFSSTDANSRRE